MTGHSYSELPSLIIELKRARIDAWMKSEDWTVVPGGYSYFDQYTGFQFVSAPDANAEGGGTYTLNGNTDVPGGPIDRYSTAFDTIRSAVDDHLFGWDTLPDPANIQRWITPLKPVLSQLASDSIDSDGNLTGASGISGTISTCEEITNNHWAGHSAAAFNLNFLQRLRPAVSGSYGMCLILGGALESQKGMWTGARQAVVDIVVETTKAYKAVIQDSGFDWGLAFKIAGWAVAGVAIFATGGAALAAGVAGLAIEVGSDFAPEPKDVPGPGASYEAIRDKMPTLFSDLRDKIITEEQGIQDNLTQNTNTVLDNKASYDLTLPPVGGDPNLSQRHATLLDVDDDSDLSKDNLFVGKQFVLDMADIYLPDIGRRLTTSASQLGEVAGYGTHDFWRGACEFGTIGIDSYGPHNDWLNLYFGAHAVTEANGKLTTQSAKTLALVIADIGQADTDAQDALEKHHAKLKDFYMGGNYRFVHRPGS